MELSISKVHLYQKYIFSRFVERTYASSTSRKAYANLLANQTAALPLIGKNIPFDTENFQNLKPKNLAKWRGPPVLVY